MITPEWFLGEVVDIENDPERLGRVRVKLFQTHDFIGNTEDFIWSHIMMPPTSESLKGVGQTPSLAVGSRVMGFFSDGKSRRVSIITGSMLFNPMEDNGSSDHSLSFMARGKNSVEKKKLGYEEPDSAFAGEYPYNKVTQTKSGHVIEIDDTEGQERLHIYHKVGTYIEINKDGQISISSPDNIIEIVGKDKILEVKGDAKIAIEGNLDASVIGSISIASADTLYLGSIGDMEISTSGALILSAAKGISLRSPAGVVATASITSLGNISSATGATGSFATATGKIVSVSKGLVTEIE